MARTRQRAKGRRGGEGERFAYLPESVLLSEAVRTLPHAAFKVLAILMVGRSRERNGTACCSDSYATKYGITSHNTLRRALEELQARGLIVVTRRVSRFRRHPTLYGVTWWPLMYRDGELLAVPQPPSHAYANWRPITPTIGVNDAAQENNRSPPPWGDITPTMGVNGAVHHPHGVVETVFHHPHHGGQSLDLGRGRTRTRSSRMSPPAFLAVPRIADIDPDLVRKVEKLSTVQSHLTTSDIARVLHADAAVVDVIRQHLGARP